MTNQEIINCDLAIIGAGMTGMAAALFAKNRGINTVQLGRIDSGIIFASSLVDLLGVHPISEKKIIRQPWEGLAQLVKDLPLHPYARINPQDIKTALNEMLSFFEEAGYPYCWEDNLNVEVLTAQGTLKPTYCVPRTMWAGVKALQAHDPCLIVGLQGLKEFSARQITNVLEQKWPELRAITISFPGTDNHKEVFAAHLARKLELAENRTKFAKLVKPELGNAKAVGLPAILGIKQTNAILNHLEEEIGVPVFEIPTMPTSVPGLRLKEIFATRLYQGFEKVKSVYPQDGSFLLDTGEKHAKVQAQAVLLATGRFMSKGLIADRTSIRENIFDLPVTQPLHRQDWHTVKFLDPGGHPVDQAGLETDSYFRPVDQAGTPIYPNLFAAGSILAHQDWKRMKCGAGLAFASAYAAVNAFMSLKIKEF